MAVIDYLEILPSGLRLAWDDDGSQGTVSVAIYVGVGSRDESFAQWGSAHFLEHLLFKGAGPWDVKTLAARMDSLGGEVNAYTTRDYTACYAKVLALQAPDAWTLLRTLVFEPWLHADDVDRERQVIREELQEALDDPEDRCEEAYLEALYPSSSLAHDILGTQQSLTALTVGDLRAFYKQWYVPANMCVAVSGYGAESLASMIRRDMAAPAPGNVFLPERPPVIAHGGEVHRQMPGGQVHLMFGAPAPRLGDPGHPAALLTAAVLGGQNSSRLWQRLREDAGLVYTVATGYSAQPDWAEMSTYLALQPENLTRALEITGSTLREFLEQGPTEDEMERARILLATNLAFVLETPEGRAGRLGRWGLLNQSPPTLKAVTRMLQNTGREEIMHTAQEIWGHPQTWAVATAGNLGKNRHAIRQGLVMTSL